MDQKMFIKSIVTDDQGRIIVNVQDEFQNYLKEDMTKKMLRETAVKALGENFIQLEVSKSTFRVTVKEGTSDESKVIIETEITKSIEMALNFLSQFNQN